MEANNSRPPTDFKCHTASHPAFGNPGHERFCFRPNLHCDAASKVIEQRRANSSLASIKTDSQNEQAPGVKRA